FPMSAAEIGYDHGVTLLDLDDGLAPRHIPLPRPVPMHRLPASGTAPLAEVVSALNALDLQSETPRDAQPFIYLSLIADRPVTQIAAEAEALIEALPVRLAGLTIARSEAEGTPETPPSNLTDTSPEDLFLMAFNQSHGVDPDAAHLAAFRDALSEI
ncbi:MAG: exonuclease sbcCD subunit D, partial [Rhodobacterales bacterium 17-64-5]